MPLLKRVSSRWIGSNHNRIWGLHDDSISAERGTNPKSAITITHPYQTWGDNVPPSWIESRYTDNIIFSPVQPQSEKEVITYVESLIFILFRRRQSLKI